MGELKRIFLRPSARTPVREVASARALAGRGIEGDHAGGGARQVTLIEQERWEEACGDLGRELSPGARRANLVVAGVRLADAIGRELRVGDCRFQIVAETRPCKLMEDAAAGLQRALDPDCRGGVYCRILTGGELRVGDPIEIEEPRAAQKSLEFAPEGAGA